MIVSESPKEHSGLDKCRMKKVHLKTPKLLQDSLMVI